MTFFHGQAGGAGPGDGGLVVNGIADGDDRAHALEHLEAIAAMAGDWALALLDKVPSPTSLTILCRELLPRAVPCLTHTFSPEHGSTS